MKRGRQGNGQWCFSNAESDRRQDPVPDECLNLHRLCGGKGFCEVIRKGSRTLDIILERSGHPVALSPSTRWYRVCRSSPVRRSAPFSTRS